MFFPGFFHCKSAASSIQILWLCNKEWIAVEERETTALDMKKYYFETWSKKGIRQVGPWTELNITKNLNETDQQKKERKRF